ncbi:MAG: adenylosuccinate synthase [Deltaproteobacteria bacterium]|jgi:adenylosuccinate synthase|nr:adenylosuccinate synthase [Deltaproteobacteria bacterium]
MTNLAVIGTQWGDEGKGKVVDLLAEGADMVVRFQGGNNAGHTLVVGGSTYALHLVPSGILHPEKTSVVASGVVVDPGVLIGEIKALTGRGVEISPRNLKISGKAHVILPYHKRLDEARESAAGAGKIGTTGRGIGPTYEDKAARVGLRLSDLLDPGLFGAKAKIALEEKNCLLTNLYGQKPIEISELLELAREWASFLSPYIVDTFEIIHNASKEGKNILFEGAQGVQLDIDHGTYPFVTSSNPTAGAVSVGSGLPPNELHKVMGLVKAYTSRVGEGPFPTELADETGQRIREIGGEYGTTTGRPRRCGWLDAVVVRTAVDLCGIESLAVTKLDVLRGLPEIKMATSYRLGGKSLAHVPGTLSGLAQAEPVYETFKGFDGDISAAKGLGDLPPEAKAFLDRLAEAVGARIGLVSVGPERDQTIVLDKPFGAPARAGA